MFFLSFQHFTIINLYDANEVLEELEYQGLNSTLKDYFKTPQAVLMDFSLRDSSKEKYGKQPLSLLYSRLHVIVILSIIDKYYFNVTPLKLKKTTNKKFALWDFSSFGAF